LEAGTDTFDRAGSELVAASLRAGHAVRVRVAGSSMVPSLWPGDELIVRALGAAEPSRGDLLLFVRNGRLCTHRLMSRSADSGVVQLITRGDTALKSDPPHELDQILGSVVSVLRNGNQAPLDSSRAGKVLSFAIRHSGFLRRVVLKMHALRRDSWTPTQTRCRA